MHRAILTLVVAAIIARTHRLSGFHHATFVLLGPKLTWKTWILRMACLIAGIWFPAVVPIAAIGLAILMLGAIAMHFKVKDPMMKSLPAFTMLVLSSAVVLI